MEQLVTGNFNLTGLKISNKKVEEIDFTLHNPNSHTLTITSANASCGCTALKPGQSTLHPGDNKVTVTLNKLGQTGFVSQSVQLLLSNNQKIDLSLSGNLE